MIGMEEGGWVVNEKGNDGLCNLSEEFEVGATRG